MYRYYEDRIVLLSKCVSSVIRWLHAMREHPGAKEFALDFNKWLYSIINAKGTFL